MFPSTHTAAHISMGTLCPLQLCAVHHTVPTQCFSCRASRGDATPEVDSRQCGQSNTGMQGMSTAAQLKVRSRSQSHSHRLSCFPFPVSTQKSVVRFAKHMSALFLAMTKAPLGAHATHHIDRVMRISWGSPRLKASVHRPCVIKPLVHLNPNI